MKTFLIFLAIEIIILLLSYAIINFHNEGIVFAKWGVEQWKMADRNLYVILVLVFTVANLVGLFNTRKV